MTETTGAEDANVTFHVKSSGGQKYTLTVPLSMTTIDLKNKLASEEYANVPASAQRLIYSGKVLKDHETLALHNVKEGNTMHLIKSAASNQRQNPAAQSTSTSELPGDTPQGVPGVPQNLSSGTGNDPLAGLTGARYAGFAQLPSASAFQENANPEDLMRQLDNPVFRQMMREALGNPQMQDMIINQTPHLRAMGPAARQMMNTEYFRNMMTDPNMLRSMMQMNQSMGMGGFGGAGGQAAFPAPGVTNTTEGSTGTSENASSNQTEQPRQQQPPLDPFAMLQAYGNPFGNNPGAQAGGNVPQNQQPPNPFMALFPQPGQQAGQQPSGNTGTSAPPPYNNPFNPQTNPFMQNPEAMQQMFQQMMGGQQGGSGNDMGNPFNMFGAGAGAGGQPVEPADTRPPEERYASQLRQLNEMGFYDFDRNIQALRRTGGNVNGAIEFLLGSPTD